MRGKTSKPELQQKTMTEIFDEGTAIDRAVAEATRLAAIETRRVMRQATKRSAAPR